MGLKNYTLTTMQRILTYLLPIESSGVIPMQICNFELVN